VVRVIIAGEWIWVEPGTYRVQDVEFVDDDGNEINRSSEPAYQVTSTNGDPYFGPLSAIQLIKLRSPELDALRPEPAPSQELPQPREAAAAPADAAVSESQRAADSLFSDPIPMPSGDTAQPGRGLL
jgi:hypothetical protein